MSLLPISNQLCFRSIERNFYHPFFLLVILIDHGRAEISGAPITDNNYRLDLRQGPIIVSAKQVALGGAYIGLAEGITSLNSNPVGVESVLAQKKQPIGTHTRVSVRLGTELETIPGRLRVRLGSYYEPSFFEDIQGRTHLTGGIETRLFHTSIWGEYDWGLTYTVDYARNYLNQFVSIGFWYF